MGYSCVAMGLMKLSRKQEGTAIRLWRGRRQKQSVGVSVRVPCFIVHILYLTIHRDLRDNNSKFNNVCFLTEELLAKCVTNRGVAVVFVAFVLRAPRRLVGGNRWTPGKWREDR